MANLTERRNKDGVLISYGIKVYRGTGADGKQLKPYTSTYKVEPGWSEKTARKKAETFAANFEKQCKEGLVSDGKQTIEGYIRYYIELKSERGLKPTTAALYKSILERLVAPRIGYIKLKDLQAKDLNGLYKALSADGLNKNGGKLSGKTILEVHRLLHSVLGQAVREGVIPFNAADRVDPPKRIKKDATYYEPDTVDKILDAADNEPEQWRVLILFLLASGCRRGEALGLAWEDVDFDHSRVYIHRNLTYTKEKGPYLDSPKTAKSVRYIALPAKVMAALRHHKAEQAGLKIRVGVYYEDEGFVFTRDNGKPLHPCSVTSYLTKFSKRYDLPHIHPHALRHTSASLLIFAGVDPVTVSHRLGHDEVSTTLDIYSHMIADADSRSADIIGDALNLKKA